MNRKQFILSLLAIPTLRLLNKQNEITINPTILSSRGNGEMEFHIVRVDENGIQHHYRNGKLWMINGPDNDVELILEDSEIYKP